MKTQMSNYCLLHKSLFLLLLVYAFMLANTCMSCPDIQSHTVAPVPDFVQRRGSNSVRSALPAAFHARTLQAAEESRLCYFHLSGILPAHWPAPIPAVHHLCGATTTHTTLHTHHQKSRPHHSCDLAEDRRSKQIHLELICVRVRVGLCVCPCVHVCVSIKYKTN